MHGYLDLTWKVKNPQCVKDKSLYQDEFTSQVR